MVVVNYNKILQANTADSMVAACQRWGCNLIELSETNWQSNNSPMAIKTEVFRDLPLGGTHYQAPDEVLVLDADTMISEACPNPFEVFPDEDLFIAVANGNVERFGDFSGIKAGERAEWAKVFKWAKRIEPSMPHEPNTYFNSGMMIARKNRHGHMFNRAFNLCQANLGLGWGDQTPLNWAAREMGIQVRLAAETWNFIHPHTLGPGWKDMERTGKFIYHFAGDPQRIKNIEQVKWQSTNNKGAKAQRKTP